MLRRGPGLSGSLIPAQKPCMGDYRAQPSTALFCRTSEVPAPSYQPVAGAVAETTSSPSLFCVEACQLVIACEAFTSAWTLEARALARPAVQNDGMRWGVCRGRCLLPSNIPRSGRGHHPSGQRNRLLGANLFHPVSDENAKAIDVRQLERTAVHDHIARPF